MQPRHSIPQRPCRTLSTALALAALCSTANAQTCERFQTLSLDQQTQVLDSNDRSDPECTAFLIKNLGEKHYESAIRAIVKHSDFRWQEPEPRVRQTPIPWEEFPAFQALYSIGEKSAPAIIEYLGSRDLSELERKRNVMLVLCLLEPRAKDAPKGVRALVRASRSATDPAVAGRLWRAATALCEDPICRAALLERPNQ